MFYRASIPLISAVLSAIVMITAQHSAPPDLEASSIRPVVPGKLLLRMQSRIESKQFRSLFDTVVRNQEWDVSETAIIVCDMWNDNYCKRMAQRVDQIVPRLNATLSDARELGVMVIHAPSGVVDHYSQTPQRKRMLLQTPTSSSSTLGWCHRDPVCEPELPLDVSKQTCGDPVIAPSVRVFSRQHPGIDIIGFDGISDSGDEIVSFLQKQGIKNVAMTGVSTNGCVLGRPFGIRQLVRLGFNVVLVRDLTESSYDPRQPPYVSHKRGSQLVLEHIEKYWCPTVGSADLRRVIVGTDGPVVQDQ